MRALWLQLPLVAILALSARISAIDVTGDPTNTWLLCAATTLAGSFFVIRHLSRLRAI